MTSPICPVVMRQTHLCTILNYKILVLCLRACVVFDVFLSRKEMKLACSPDMNLVSQDII